MVMCIISLILFFVFIKKQQYRNLAVLQAHIVELFINCINSVACLIALLQVSFTFPHLGNNLFCSLNLGSWIKLQPKSWRWTRQYSVDNCPKWPVHIHNVLDYWCTIYQQGSWHETGVDQCIGLLDSGHTAIDLHPGRFEAQSQHCRSGKKALVFFKSNVLNLLGSPQTRKRDGDFLVGLQLLNVGHQHSGNSKTRFESSSNVFLWVSFTLAESNNTNVFVCYRFWAWTIITHVTMPLTIFYRFHSTVCLCEIWKSTYKIKNEYN